MKIHQLLSSDLKVPVTNEEQRFIDMHENTVKLSSLDDHDRWVAQSLVRKNIYRISNDNITLEKNSNEQNTQ